MAYLSEYNTDKQFTATVMYSTRLTPEDTDEIREIFIEVNDRDFHCKVDQSFGVLVKTDNEFGNSYHHRLYSVADLPTRKENKTNLTMLVKRCYYVDEFSGEQYEGVGSNYLCDRKAGDKITITGPFNLPFSIPDDPNANLILIGMGTGIAPFRAFIKHIYEYVEGFRGKIMLFYGAKSGLELLYLNDKGGDLTNYYDETTFEAIQALSPRPEWDDPIELDQAVEERSDEIIEMLYKTNAYVYVAGYEKIRDVLDGVFTKSMGSEEKWKRLKSNLASEKRWVEIVY